MSHETQMTSEELESLLKAAENFIRHPTCENYKARLQDLINDRRKHINPKHHHENRNYHRRVT